MVSSIFLVEQHGTNHMARSMLLWFEAGPAMLYRKKQSALHGKLVLHAALTTELVEARLPKGFKRH